MLIFIIHTHYTKALKLFRDKIIKWELGVQLQQNNNKKRLEITKRGDAHFHREKSTVRDMFGYHYKVMIVIMIMNFYKRMFD